MPIIQLTIIEPTFGLVKLDFSILLKSVDLRSILHVDCPSSLKNDNLSIAISTNTEFSNKLRINQLQCRQI